MIAARTGSAPPSPLRASGKMKLDELFMVWLSLPETRVSLDRILSDVAQGSSVASAIASLSAQQPGAMDLDDSSDPVGSAGLPGQGGGAQHQPAHHPHPDAKSGGKHGKGKGKGGKAPHSPGGAGGGVGHGPGSPLSASSGSGAVSAHEPGTAAASHGDAAMPGVSSPGGVGSGGEASSPHASSPPHIQVAMHPRVAEALGGAPAPPRSPTGSPGSPGGPRSPSRSSSLLSGSSSSSSTASSGSSLNGEKANRSASAAAALGGAGHDVIPQFYWPGGRKPHTSEETAAERARACAAFKGTGPRAALDIEAFREVTTTGCGLPSFFNGRLFERCGGKEGGKVTRAQFVSYWDEHLAHRDDAECMFELLLPEAARPGEKRRDHLQRGDFVWMLDEIVRTHPGLEFLEATPEFQDKYKETVEIRIFYTVNRNGSGRLTLRDMRASDLPEVTKHLDEEPDINKVTRYYSYEAFYVLYCKHWEIDTDHDHLLDRDDLLRYGNYSLTFRVVDRIFGEYPRKLTSGVPGRMSYEDFCWFLLSEEDKTTAPALAYWHRCLDLDGDGAISVVEMRHFYQEQLHRMECISQEVVAFEDVLCQMHDLIKPEREGFVTLRDLKRCAEADVFINALTNLNKLIAYEQRDPFQMRADAQLGLTPWEKFVRVEYDAMAADEADEEGGGWDDGYDDAGGAGGTIEAPF